MSTTAAAAKLGWPLKSFLRIVARMGIPDWPWVRRRVAQAQKTGHAANGKRRSQERRREDQMRQYMPTFQRLDPKKLRGHQGADKHAQIVAWATGGSQTDPAPTTVSMSGDAYGVFAEAQDEDILNLNPALLAQMRMMDQVYGEFTAQGGASWM
jgi:hypothetical protein